MSTRYGRHQRVAALVQRELAALLQSHADLAALPGLLTLSHVRVSADLSVADVYVTLLTAASMEQAGDAAEPLSAPMTETLELLNQAAPALRRDLAGRVALRAVPTLRFHQFDTPRRAAHLDAILDDLLQPGKCPDDSS